MVAQEGKKIPVVGKRVGDNMLRNRRWLLEVGCEENKFPGEVFLADGREHSLEQSWVVMVRQKAQN